MHSSDVSIKFRARTMRSGGGLYIRIPTALTEMVEHRGLYLVTLEPLEEGEEHG